jgi:pyrroline-5-carboxylate reductase
MGLKGKKVAFIGAGNMAEAIIRGLLKASVVAAPDILATGRRQERIDDLHKLYGLTVTLDNRKAASEADVVVLSVKPQILEKVLAEIGDAISKDALVISVAAGITMGQIRSHLSDQAKVCRSMPNMPSVVGAGAAALVCGEFITEEDKQMAHELFESCGLAVELHEESLLDAATGLSGSGPAYVFMIIEALSDAGVKVGLNRRQAQKLAAQTVLGSAQLVIETGEHPGVLKDQVTSPGGTAIAGLHTLEEGGLRTTLINGVVAATERSKELATIKKS